LSSAISQLPPEAQGLARSAAQQGMAMAAQYASEQLGSDVMGVVNKVMSGDASQIAQVGMELGSKVVEKAFGEAGVLNVTQHPVRSQSEADALAKAIFGELTGGNLQAEGVAIGNPKLTAGCKVKLKALGSKFSGEYFVSHTRHTYDSEDGYLTEFTISGSNPDTFVDLLFGGSGSNPGMSGNGAPAGVVVGIVTNNKDPDGHGRVKVKFPWLSNDEESNWARIASPMAGADRGLFILPEVNDEVLVMFEQGDVNHPYVIGALWNGTDKPPLSADQAVDGSGNVVRRILKTRAGHTITLDESDDSPGIQIVDKTGNNKIVIDSKDNKLLVNLDGDVSLESKGKITITTNNGDVTIECQNFSVKAQQKAEVEAQMDLSLKSATSTAKMEGVMMEVSGSASGKVTSSGVLEVQGSLVKIN
jgi:phage baseplate assembly protein gpV